jgi:cytoskeleton protein RodZ
MSEELENQAGPAAVNPGELLRSERERVGFTADEVASHLHLSKSTLAYLEAGRFDRLPGDTFTRGYIRSYARLLKLDPAVLTQHYDRYAGSEKREPRVAPINRVQVAPRRASCLIMWFSTLVIVVSMLALGLWWWSDSRDAGLPPADSDVRALIDDVQVDAMALPGSFTNPEAEAPEAEAISEPALEDLIEPEAAPLDAPAPVADTVEPPAVVQEPQVQAPAEAAPVTPTANEPASGRGLSMTFSDNCWVQVSVPGGRVLHSAQMGPGQTLNIEQQGPLDLVIGAAAAVSTIEYNGQPVELNANRQSGVARLRLGQ